MIPGPWKFDNFPLHRDPERRLHADRPGAVRPGRRFPGPGEHGATVCDRGRSQPEWLAVCGPDGGHAARGAGVAGSGGFSVGAEQSVRLLREGELHREDEGAPDEPYGDRVERNRAVARVEVTRTIVGPLAVAVAGGHNSDTWSALPGQSHFGDFADRFGGTIEEDDSWGRVALVLDTRDDEFEPRRGVLVEGGVITGSGGLGNSEGYSGGYGVDDPHLFKGGDLYDIHPIRRSSRFQKSLD